METIKQVGFVGLGFVGQATYTSFEKRGIKVVGYDKYRQIGSLEDVSKDSDVIFLCLPTLYSQSLGEYDKTAIHEICDGLRSLHYQGLVIIKSTVEVSVSENLFQKYGLKIIHNPEFLTARTALYDVDHQSHIVIGKTSGIKLDDVDKLYRFYQTYYPSAKISITTSGESETMKIFVNNFYAMKIQIFNEFYLMCGKTGVNYENVKNLMLENGWINPNHTNIPGPDGSLSYGGACFPKDTQALLAQMKKLETPHAILDACVKERNSMRKD
jgi:UDPglucose 6-dehydrogenase